VRRATPTVSESNHSRHNVLTSAGKSGKRFRKTGGKTVAASKKQNKKTGSKVTKVGLKDLGTKSNPRGGAARRRVTTSAINLAERRR
jgi:hypothetical protein